MITKDELIKMKADYDAQIRRNCEDSRRMGRFGSDPDNYDSFYSDIEDQMGELQDEGEEMGWTDERKDEWRRLARIHDAMNREGGKDVFDTRLGTDLKTYVPHKKHWSEDLF
jgi:hypothetical protein